MLVTMVPFYAAADESKDATSSEKSYVGSAVCAGCHATQYEAWSSSHHAQAMMMPTQDTVAGDFSGVRFEDKGVVSTFSRSGDDFVIKIKTKNGREAEHKVAYTFGVYPLQQYLIKTEGGRYQAYDVAWDARPSQDGGQRWYKLLPDEDSSESSPFHWTRHTQNWNSRCADCHSTGLDKGFDATTNSYETTFSELNVACEACHGKGSEHVRLVGGAGVSDVAHAGFDMSLVPSTQFSFVEQKDIAVGKGVQNNAQVNACGGCHSRRQQIGDVNPADDFHNQFVLRRVDSPLYFADGQIQDEVFVLGSYLQSKMAKAGVQCTHCHEPHSGELKVEGNGVCTQCHKPTVYNASSHHKHKPESEAAQCVTCHMPDTTYMGVDDRRDHSFRVPHPENSALVDSKNVCQDCHQAQSAEWAQGHINVWADNKPFDPFATLNFKAQQGDPLALRAVVDYVNQKQMPGIKRATLLASTGRVPSRLTAETIQGAISSPDPMVRAAALDASDFIPLQHRYGIFRGLIDDESALVRYALARQLAGYEQALNGAERAALVQLLDAYEEQLKRSEDLPAGQLQLADYYMRRGMSDLALAAYDQALVIEPAFSVALLNKADLYRALGDENNAERSLKRALDTAPDSGAVQHSFGLNLVRQGRKQEALKHLLLATESNDANARYFYVYAIALDGAQKTDEALRTLLRANERWPNQYDILFGIVTFLEKQGRENESLTYLSNLSAIAPNDPAVKQRIERASK